MHHLEEAAIGFHPQARYNLGCHEWDNGKTERAVLKHWIIAAAQGDDDSIKMLIEQFKSGVVSKDDLAAACSMRIVCIVCPSLSGALWILDLGPAFFAFCVLPSPSSCPCIAFIRLDTLPYYGITFERSH